MKKFGKFIVLLVLAGLAWTAWAVAAFYDLTLGLHNGDPIALERRIDWTSVRQALREDLQTWPPAPPGRERPVETLLSTPAIINLLRTAKVDERGWETVALPAPAGAPAVFDRNRIRYAFYTGSPFSFRVDIRADSDVLSTPLVLLFRWTGDWRLVRIFLPTPALMIASASPSPPMAPPPPGVHRAALYEETSGSPQGKHTNGTVTWRTVPTPPAVAGGEPGFTVVAQVSMPARPLNMTMEIRPNLDTSLPASHTIDINFGLPTDSTSSVVTDALGVMMKPNEEAPGQQLAGSRVKVRDNYFIIGLSSLEVDVRHNTDVLRNRPWFGIPIRFQSGNRAVLVIEKGDTGEKVFAEAFTRWNATTGASAQKK